MVKVFELDCKGCEYVGEGMFNEDGPSYDMDGNRFKGMAYRVDGTTVIDWECKHCSTENKSKKRL